MTSQHGIDTQDVTQSQVKRWRELLASERDAAALYSRLADAESGERQQIFRDLAGIERRHASHWEDKLRSAGAPVPAPAGPACGPGCSARPRAGCPSRPCCR